MPTGALALLVAMVALTACGGNEVRPLPEAPPDAAAIEVRAPRFTNGRIVKPRYACDGVNLSPDVAWSGVPPGARTVVLVLDDPDAPEGQFIHWLVYNLPPDVTELIEAAGKPFEVLPQGGRQTENSFDDLGYSGPCPPRGETHTYELHVFALDLQPALPSQPSRNEVFAAMEGAIIGHGLFETTYRRMNTTEGNVVFKTPIP